MIKRHFFLVAAAVIFYQLRSVLGRRTGDDANNAERWRSQKPAPGAPAGTDPLPENVSRFPDRTAPAAPDGPAPAPGTVEAGVGTILGSGGRKVERCGGHGGGLPWVDVGTPSHSLTRISRIATSPVNIAVAS